MNGLGVSKLELDSDEQNLALRALKDYQQACIDELCGDDRDDWWYNMLEPQVKALITKLEAHSNGL